MEGTERSLSMDRFSAPMACHANGLAREGRNLIGAKCLVASCADVISTQVASRLPANTPRGILHNRELSSRMLASHVE
jgi:hypothetical protein